MERQFDIWVMPEYGFKESWTRAYSIGPLVGINGPLKFWKDDELLMEISTGHLVSCEIKELPVHANPGSLQVVLYTESLLSIKSENTRHGQYDGLISPWSFCICIFSGSVLFYDFYFYHYRLV